jgi:hypothetical protein
MSTARIAARIVLALAVSVPTAASIAGPAGAEDPVILEGFCSFPITHEFPKFHIAHAAPLPTTHAPIEGFDTGQQFVVVTNVLNGKSVTLQSNSTLFFMHDGTAWFRGSAVAFFDSPRGEIPAGVWLVVGNVHVTLGPGDRVVSATGGVLRRDICAELA